MVAERFQIKYVELVIGAPVVQHLLEGDLGLLPQRRLAHGLLGLGRQFHSVLEAKDLVEAVHEVDDPGDLRLHLLLGAVDVSIILRELDDPEQPGQHARQLHSVHLSELQHAQGQLAVAPLPAAEHQDAAGAVHGLDGELPVIVLGEEDIVLVVRPVSRHLPQYVAHHLGGLDLLVAGPLVLLP